MKEIKDLIKYFKYLEELRESGKTNMFGATPYLMEEFNLSQKQARKVLQCWMNLRELAKQ